MKKNSGNTTKVTDRAFNAAQICAILKACENLRVKALVLARGDLSVEFFPDSSSETSSKSKLEPQSQLPLLANQNPEEVVPSGKEIPSSPHGALFTPVDRALVQELERAQLLIDDPADFENLMIEENIERGRFEENNGTRRTEDRGSERDILPG